MASAASIAGNATALLVTAACAATQITSHFTGMFGAGLAQDVFVGTLVSALTAGVGGFLTGKFDYAFGIINAGKYLGAAALGGIFLPSTHALSFG